MEKLTQKLPEVKAKSDKIQSVRFTDEAAEMLADILKKVNSKEQGRCVRATEVVALALTLITAKDIRQLQEASLSNADRLELSYQKYIRENAFIEKDAFIGRLLKGELTGIAR